MLDEHHRQPHPATLTELVTRAGFGAVESHAITQLRREIHRRPSVWSLVGSTVHLRTGKNAFVNSLSSLRSSLDTRGQAVPAASILGLYPEAGQDVCELLKSGRASLAEGSIFPSWPSSVPESDGQRLAAWLDACD